VPHPDFLRGAKWNAAKRLRQKDEGWHGMITVKSTQKIYTEDEISRLTGICSEHLRRVARSRHLGSIVRAAEAVAGQTELWQFSNTDLSVLTALFPRCEHWRRAVVLSSSEINKIIKFIPQAAVSLLVAQTSACGFSPSNAKTPQAEQAAEKREILSFWAPVLREESLLVLCFDPRGILRFAQNDKPRDFFRSLWSLRHLAPLHRIPLRAILETYEKPVRLY
jgi:hypothetical protein